jgi:hypothetical protein
MVEQKKESKRPELVYDQLQPESEGWGQVRQIAVVTGKMEVSERSADGQVIGIRSVAQVRVFLTPGGEIIGIPGGEGAPIAWQELKDVLPEKTLRHITNALGREKRRRKSRKQQSAKG